MRRALLLALLSCSHPAPLVATTTPPMPVAAPAPPAVVEKVLAEDTPLTDTDGNTFIGPAGWRVQVHDAVTVLIAPEGGSQIALVDVTAPDADAAIALAWKAVKPDMHLAVLDASDQPDAYGWSKIRGYGYKVSPNEKRAIAAGARFANGRFLVTLVDLDVSVADKRASQLGTLLGRMFPKGYTLESYANKPAAKLDAARLASLRKFVEDGMAATGTPGVAYGVFQDGVVLYSGGAGVRELGKPDKIDGKTLFMIASNTKQLTTLLLARLVDQKKLAWDEPVTQVLPQFKLGDAEVTKQVQVRHLVCACTGLPRQDLEWLLEWKGSTPESVLATLGTMVPTSKFGELFQYSNLMAAAGGFAGGHALYPKLELGAAYDKAMQTQVFDPLGMKATTFDYAKALRGDHAMPHGKTIDGQTARAAMDENYSIISARPAGAAWSNVDDLLKVVAMELAEGKGYVGKEALLERRKPNVALNADAAYGMGLMVSHKYDVEMVLHGGDMIGFHSDVMFFPGGNTGAVILTNADDGALIRDNFRRKLLELLFDAPPLADATVAASAKANDQNLAAQRKLVSVPADASIKLSARYRNKALGEIAVKHEGGKTIFDVGEFASEVASMPNADGTITFVTIAPGVLGFAVVTGPNDTLIMRDGQHEYVFEAK